MIKKLLLSLLCIGTISSTYAEETPQTENPLQKTKVVEAYQEDQTAEENKTATKTKTIFDDESETTKDPLEKTKVVEVYQEDQTAEEDKTATKTKTIFDEELEEVAKDRAEKKAIKIAEHEAEAIEEKNISLVLFTLVGNTLRMEKYDTDEINKNTNAISSEMCDKNLIMSIDLSERSLTPRSISWSNDIPGQMNISAGKKSKANYKMQLEALFKKVEDDIVAVCFDCEVANKKAESDKENGCEAHIKIVFPIKIDDADITFILDKRVKSACGFFMESDHLEGLINISGNLTKKEVLKGGLLSKEQKTFFASVVSKIKNRFTGMFAKLLLVKKHIGSLFNRK